MPRLVVLDAAGDAFVEGLRRTWDDGDAVLPLDPRLPAPARAALLAAARLEDPTDDGDALVVATSGSTGQPKLAVLTHAAVLASATATSRRLRVDSARDHWLACLPLAHVGGLSVVTRALLTGTPLTVHERVDVAAIEAAGSAGCTLTSLVPAVLSRVDVRSFRRVLVGGDAVPAQRPQNVVATYGMTETGSGVVYDGTPLDGVEVRVDDEGVIRLRCPMLLRAYRDGHDPKDADGWFTTADVGQLDHHGLQVRGRRDDVIITGGEKVWPVTVEQVLRTHPLVHDVLVVGRPDAEWGQRVVALVVPAALDAPPSLDELRGHAKEQLPSHAAPTVLNVVTELPRLRSGKVRRPGAPEG